MSRNRSPYSTCGIPKRDVVSLVEHRIKRLDRAVDAVALQGRGFRADLEAFLRRYGFAESFIALASPDLVEAFLNEDDTPLWHQPFYITPGNEP